MIEFLAVMAVVAHFAIVAPSKPLFSTENVDCRQVVVAPANRAPAKPDQGVDTDSSSSNKMQFWLNKKEE